MHTGSDLFHLAVNSSSALELSVNLKHTDGHQPDEMSRVAEVSGQEGGDENTPGSLGVNRSDASRDPAD